MRTCLTFLVVFSALTSSGAERLPLSQRSAFRGDYPRAIFFRSVERPRSYEEWENSFDDLMGFIGQALPDQLSDHVGGIPPSVAQNYRRFKERHPEQIVLLHVNGLSQVPTMRTMNDFPGHWLYFEGAKVLEDVPAAGGRSTLPVSSTKLFTLKAGFERSRPDHIGLCELDDAGRPDWRRAEYVRLVSIDSAGSSITVERARFGSEPMVFEAGRGYAAALVTHGPWNRERGELEWHYNFSAKCPRDEKGRNAADMYVEYFTRAMGQGGVLENIDGVAFDVMYLTPQILGGQWRFRMPDYNGDGKGEDFRTDTTYMVGLNEFYRNLRKSLGEDYILTSDVQELNNQRAFGILNGGESENWLTHTDPETKHWSSGINRNLFWEAHALRPTFNYLNHKFFPPNLPPRPGNKVPFQPIPFNQHRLKMAAAVLTDAVITNIRSSIDRFGVWDELIRGKDKKGGWLGKALGPMTRLARSTPPLLGDKWTSADGLMSKLGGENVRFMRDGEAVRVESVGKGDLRFEIKGVPLDGPDLTIFATMRAAGRDGFPPEHARVLFASAGVKGIPHSGLGRSRLDEDNRDYALLNSSEFVAVFYFKKLEGKSVDIEFCLESSEPLWIRAVEAYASPDAVYREFEHGVVVANPGTHPYRFNLAQLLPGRSYRRISGTGMQDPRTNNGQPVGGSIELPPLDALFLVRDNESPILEVPRADRQSCSFGGGELGFALERGSLAIPGPGAVGAAGFPACGSRRKTVASELDND